VYIYGVNKDLKESVTYAHGIEAVILDLGGVIVPLDYDRTYRLFQERFEGVSADTFCGGRIQDEVFNLYETGRIDSEAFRLSFRDPDGLAADPAWFQDAWNAMILSLPADRIDWLRRLKSRTRLFLYSNINSTHFSFLNRLFAEQSSGQFSDLFEKAYFSHLFGVRKPNLDGFRRILSENGLDPSRTLFVDDGLHHVEAARKLGIRGEHLKPGETVERLIASFGLLD